MRWLFGSSLSMMLWVVPSFARADIADELATIPGLTLIEEQPEPAPGLRFFLLSYTQPIDHLDPTRGSFEQRLTLLHRSESAPMVAFTSGYGLRLSPSRSEPAALIDGNQIGIEERFFEASRPEPADFADLNIYQAAADHHRVIEALRPLYPGKWLSTGGSKGGMATVYHRRFFEGDIDGSVVYVAPNDVVDGDDSYAEFLEQVGSAECRDRLHAVQRAALLRRDEIVPVMAQVAREAGLSFELIGSADRAYELTIVELFWTFWQYSLERDCASVPGPDAPLEDLIGFVGDVVGLTSFSDDNQLPFIPFYYQAGTQLGYPDVVEISAPIADLLRYPGLDSPRNLVPADIPLQFDPLAMADIDRWVKERGQRLLFIYGENDPWSAEPFEPGPGTLDSYWYTAPGANHGARISTLAASDQLPASNIVRAWAGLPPVPPVDSATGARAGPTPQTVGELFDATSLDSVDPFESRPRL
jgi:PS-10 peptidase S37